MQLDVQSEISEFTLRWLAILMPEALLSFLSNLSQISPTKKVLY